MVEGNRNNNPHGDSQRRRSTRPANDAQRAQRQSSQRQTSGAASSSRSSGQRAGSSAERYQREQTLRDTQGRSSTRSGSGRAGSGRSSNGTRQGSERAIAARSAGSQPTTYPRSRPQYNREQYIRDQYTDVKSEASQFSRGNYTVSSGYRGQRKRDNKRTKLIVGVLLGVLALAAIAVVMFIHMSPINVIVNGKVVEVPYNETYKDLHDDGYLKEAYGNLVAVDGSILQTGEGQIYKIYDNGELVENYDKRLSKNSSVTDAQGDDTVEDHTETTESVPWTWDIQGGENYNFYNGSLTLAVNPGTDGINRYWVGSTSGLSVLSDTSTAMVPRLVKVVTVTPPSDQKVIALTFDDGPSSEYTEEVMAVLQEYGVTATFFELGQNVSEYPQISAEVAANGYQVGSHGNIHGGDDTPYMRDMTAEQLTSDLNAASSAISSATGEDPSTIVVRPSGGNLNYDAIVNAGTLVNCYVGWDIDTEDWRKPGAETIANNLVSGAFPGAIALMHDGGGDRSQTVEALKIAIPQLQAEGYTFVTVNQLIDMQMTQYKADGTAVSTS